MKNYIILNKDKLIWSIKSTAIMLTTVFLVWTWYKCVSVDCFISSDFILGLIITLFILPTITVILEAISGYIVFWRTEKFFDSNPINELFNDGFTKEFTQEKSKWLLIKLSAVGQFNNYNMICEVENGRLRIIAKTNYDHLDRWADEEINLALQSSRHVRFEYDGQGIATSLKIKDVKKMSFEGLQSYLQDFSEMLKKLKIEKGSTQQ